MQYSYVLSFIIPIAEANSIQPHDLVLYLSQPRNQNPLLTSTAPFTTYRKQSEQGKEAEGNLNEIGLPAGVVLRLWTDLDIGGLVDDFLHGVLDKLVEGVKLLAHEALLLEVGADDRPGVLLGDLIVLVVLHHGVVVRHRGPTFLTSDLRPEADGSGNP